MRSWLAHSFKRQLFVVFLAVMLILVISGGFLTVQGFRTRLRQDYARNDLLLDKEITEHIMSLLDEVQEAIDGIAGDGILRQAMEGGTGNNSSTEAAGTGSAINTKVVYSALYQHTQTVRNRCAVDLYLGNSRLYTTSTGAAAKSLPLDYSVLWEASENPGRTIYSLDPGEASEQGASLLIVQQLWNGTEKGYVVFRVSEENIKDLLSSRVNARDGFILTNRFLRPLCQLGAAEDGEDLALVRKNLMNRQDYTAGAKNNIYITELGDTGLLSLYITPPVLDSFAVNVEYRIIFLLAIIGVILCSLVASRMSAWASKPIAIFTQAMQDVRNGDLDTRITLHREDEFGQLASGFNDMTSRLKEYMEEQVLTERKLNETRIAMMQAQLNPHFLYNTLDTIKWVAKSRQVPEVATLSSRLASILRSSISRQEFVLLEQELKLVENYCDIQRIRFDDSFDLSIDVSDELLKCVVPKLILQPIVENSIIHGLEGQDNGHIEIKAFAENFSESEDTADTAGESNQPILHITVTDNGCGISDEMLRLLEDTDPESLTGHLGLANVGTIIKLYHGADYGIHAERPAEGGTIMHLILPYTTELPDTAALYGTANTLQS